jgi:hypothetical protein
MMEELDKWKPPPVSATPKLGTGTEKKRCATCLFALSTWKRGSVECTRFRFKPAEDQVCKHWEPPVDG